MSGAARPLRVMQFAGAEVLGGLLGHLVILTRGLREAGVEVHAVLSPAQDVDEAAAACGAAGARVTRLRVAGKTNLAGLSALTALVARSAPDLFHLHLSSPVEGVPTLLAARAGGVRKLLTTEHAPTWHPLRKIYSGAAKRFSTRLIQAVIALSEEDAGFLWSEFGVPRRLIHVIPNGVPLPSEESFLLSRDAARRRLGVGSGPLIGCVGALEEKKGIGDVIDAVRALEDRGISLALAGEGSMQAGLQARAADLPFPLLLPGRVADVPAFLAALDIFVFPSHQEALPLALLEAMGAGLPIVATRVGGIPEAIQDGVSGLLVEPHRPAQIAAAVRRLLADSALARRLAAAARVRATERYSEAEMVRCTLDLYDAVARRGQPAQRGMAITA